MFCFKLVPVLFYTLEYMSLNATPLYTFLCHYCMTLYCFVPQLLFLSRFHLPFVIIMICPSETVKNNYNRAQWKKGVFLANLKVKGQLCDFIV